MVGDVEHYTPETLFERINGKDESYISKGFRSLDLQEFCLVGRPEAYLSLWVYDMGQAANAFAAFSAQRRSDAVDLNLTAHIYQSGESIYFTHGRYYAEVQVPPESPSELSEAGLTLAGSFIERTVVEQAGQLEGDALLPEQGRLPNSIELLKSHVFGFAGFDDVWLARYEIDGVMATAYVSVRSGPDEAEGLAKAYVAFLDRYGAVEGAPDAEPPAGMLVRNLYDHTYVVITRGRFVAGVHECPDPSVAYGLGLEILEHLSEHIDE